MSEYWKPENTEAILVDLGFPITHCSVLILSEFIRRFVNKKTLEDYIKLFAELYLTKNGIEKTTHSL